MSRASYAPPPRTYPFTNSRAENIRFTSNYFNMPEESLEFLLFNLNDPPKADQIISSGAIAFYQRVGDKFFSKDELFGMLTNCNSNMLNKLFETTGPLRAIDFLELIPPISLPQLFKQFIKLPIKQIDDILNPRIFDKICKISDILANNTAVLSNILERILNNDSYIIRALNSDATPDDVIRENTNIPPLIPILSPPDISGSDSPDDIWVGPIIDSTGSEIFSSPSPQAPLMAQPLSGNLLPQRDETLSPELFPAPRQAATEVLSQELFPPRNETLSPELFPAPRNVAFAPALNNPDNEEDRRPIDIIGE